MASWTVGDLRMTELSTDSEGSSQLCSSCNVDVTHRVSFRFGAPETNQGILKCFRCGLLHPPLIKRSLRVALLVGTVLTLLNQGDAILTGKFDNTLLWKIPLTYCVPFVVATYGALANNRNK